jgi:predicted nucleic acid-binding protein
VSAVFADTSALYALMDRDDANHDRAKAAWANWPEGLALVTNNYVLVETAALVQRRLGLEALRDFQSQIAPLLTVEWMTVQSHARAMEAMLTAGRRQLSLVDCASFQTMRGLGLWAAFCFDRHFTEQGFAAVPPAEV